MRAEKVGGKLLLQLFAADGVQRADAVSGVIKQPTDDCRSGDHLIGGAFTLSAVQIQQHAGKPSPSCARHRRVCGRPPAPLAL
jgi:hypothetical protein